MKPSQLKDRENNRYKNNDLRLIKSDARKQNVYVRCAVVQR